MIDRSFEERIVKGILHRGRCNFQDSSFKRSRIREPLFSFSKRRPTRIFALGFLSWKSIHQLTSHVAHCFGHQWLLLQFLSISTSSIKIIQFQDQISRQHWSNDRFKFQEHLPIRYDLFPEVVIHKLWTRIILYSTVDQISSKSVNIKKFLLCRYPILIFIPVSRAWFCISRTHQTLSNKELPIQNSCSILIIDILDGMPLQRRIFPVDFTYHEAILHSTKTIQNLSSIQHHGFTLIFISQYWIFSIICLSHERIFPVYTICHEVDHMYFPFQPLRLDLAKASLNQLSQGTIIKYNTVDLPSISQSAFENLDRKSLPWTYISSRYNLSWSTDSSLKTSSLRLAFFPAYAIQQKTEGLINVLEILPSVFGSIEKLYTQILEELDPAFVFLSIKWISPEWTLKRSLPTSIHGPRFNIFTFSQGLSCTSNNSSFEGEVSISKIGSILGTYIQIFLLFQHVMKLRLWSTPNKIREYTIQRSLLFSLCNSGL